MGGLQNDGPLLGPLNTRRRILLRTQKGDPNFDNHPIHRICRSSAAAAASGANALRLDFRGYRTFRPRAVPELPPRPPNVPLLRAFWSLLDGTWGVLKGSSKSPWRGLQKVGIWIWVDSCGCSFFGFWMRGRSYSNFLADTVSKEYEVTIISITELVKDCSLLQAFCKLWVACCRESPKSSILLVLVIQTYMAAGQNYCSRNDENL